MISFSGMSADGHIREFVERTPVVAFLKDRAGRYLYVNEAWSSLMGVAAEQVLGRRDDEILPDVMARPFMDNDRRVLDSGEPIEVEEQVLVRGEARTFLCTKFPVGSGAELAVGGIAVDISERKAASTALLRSEARYRRLVDHSPDAYMVVDPMRGCFVEVNANALRLFEMTEEELLRSDPAALSPIVQPDGRPSAETAFANIQAALGGETPVFDWVHASSRGELVPCRIWLARVELEQGYGVRATLVDLRAANHAKLALSRARAERDAIEDALPQPLAVVDWTKREIVHCNRPYERTFGLSSANLDLLLPEAVVSRALEQGRARSEAVFDDPSGRPLSFELDVSTFDPAGAGPSGRILLVLTDVTEARKEELLAGQSRRLESLGRLAGGIAHDFNNLLTIIVNSAEFLAPLAAHDRGAQEDLEVLADAAQRARTLTAQLLNFAREQAGEPAPVHVDRAIFDSQKLLRLVLGEDVQLVLDLGLPGACIWAPPGQLEQAIMNLAANAREALGGAAGRATGHVTIATAHVAGDPTRLQIVMADDGVGMSEDVLEKAFDPFFTTKTVGKGAGLGLSAVHGIVTAAGGTVRIASAPGGGTAVTMTFSVAQDVADEVDNQALLPASARGNVLLVEDELAVRKIVSRALERAGFDVISAGSPDEALARAPELRGKLAAIVSDIVMPKMNGLELVERLRPLLGPVPVLFISGYSAEALDARGLSQKDIELLPKPFTPRDLSARLERLLARG